MPDARENVRRSAHEHLARGELNGWFEQIYATANGNPDVIPWADLTPNPHLTAWLGRHPEPWVGKRTLVVGCGLGDDAEWLSERGMHVTAFDISATAVDWCKRRFPSSNVAYLTADAAAARKEWERCFDLIVEIYTLQAMAPESRPAAVANVAAWTATGGAVLVIARGREPHQPVSGPPWPLTRAELDAFVDHGLRADHFEDFMDGSTRRFRAVYRRI